MPFHVVDHPLIQHKLAILRDKDTSMRKFRELVSEITLLLAYESTRRLPTIPVEVETPLCRTTGATLDCVDLVISPILRAGLGMLPGMMEIMPTARIAYIGIKRDESTKEPQTYYFNVPNHLENTVVLVVDPMLATGGSLCGAIELVKRKNPREIIALCLIASPEGRDRVLEDHPDVSVFVGALDERLDENCFIVPGLGDAGDRMFGTS